MWNILIIILTTKLNQIEEVETKRVYDINRSDMDDIG